MNEIILRDAVETDIDELSMVRQSVWNTTYRGIYDDAVIDNFNYEHAKESFSKKINQPDIMFRVAVLDNKIIGYVCFGLTNALYKDYKYVIYYLHILKLYQGLGLGKRFFGEINNYCKEYNIDKFYVSCNKYNINAHKFYEKMGGVIDHVDVKLSNKQDEQIIFIYNNEGCEE